MPQVRPPKIQVPILKNFIYHSKKDWDSIRKTWSNSLFVPTTEGKVAVLFTEKEFAFLQRKLYFGNHDPQ